ncbi:MAG TPA: DUF177 domain-containing protein [Candidatus Limnocylindria bacterium]|nr:DUF177 domain-containing protein [Candidatus Limnocylindria bacterium]
MKLDVTQALRSPGEEISFRHEEQLPDQDLMGETVRFPEPALVTGTYHMAGDRLHIKGRLQAAAHAQCALCLAPVVHAVDVPLDETFTRLEPGQKAEDDPWEEHLTFHGSRVELGHLVLSLALLDLPMRFTCADGCAGAPEGADAAQATGNEDTAAGEHPFSALKKLFNTEEEV